MVRGLASLAVLGALGAVVATAATRLEQAAAEDTRAELVYLPDADLLRPLVLGYDQVLADVLWFRTISYFGQHYGTDRAYPWLARMCDLVTDLDPRAEHVYRFAGVILAWEAGEIDEAIRLLEKGVHALPGSWLLHYQLGIVRYFFKQDYGGAARELAQAAALPGAPPSVARMAAVLHAKQHGAQTTVQFLRELLGRADSEQLREVIQESLRDAEVASDLERLGALVATYRARVGRLPDSLTTLVAAGLLRGVPPDPYGGVYQIDPATGAVRSSTGRVPRQLRESPRLKARRAETEKSP